MEDTPVALKLELKRRTFAKLSTKLSTNAHSMLKHPRVAGAKYRCGRLKSTSRRSVAAFARKDPGAKSNNEQREVGHQLQEALNYAQNVSPSTKGNGNHASEERALKAPQDILHLSNPSSSLRVPGATRKVSVRTRPAEDTYQDVGTADILEQHGKDAHPVLQLIAQRAASGSMPGYRAQGDTAKLAIVVEGGGMRGVISGAMLMALRALGLHDCFDAVYGASAGAINLTYFLSGQPHGLNIYSEDLTDGTRFIDLRAYLRGQPVMNLDYLIDNVMHTTKPLHWDAVLQTPLEFNIVASSLDELRPVVMRGWADKHDLAEGLKASATVPQLAGPPRTVRGQRLVDAAVFEPVPVRSALRDGCTHALVLCTRPATLHTSWRKLVRGTVVHMVKSTVLNAPYMRPAFAAQVGSNSALETQDEEIVSALASCPHETRAKLGGYVLPVYPHSVAGCSPISTSPQVIKAAEAQGWRAIADLFGAWDVLLEAGAPLEMAKGGSPPAASHASHHPHHHHSLKGLRGLRQQLLGRTTTSR